MKYLDTRDLYKRQQELTDLKSNLEAAQEEMSGAEKTLAAFDPDRPDVAPDDEDWYEQKKELETAVDDAKERLEAAELDFGDDEQTELSELDDLESEISEWRHGETMIPEDSFEDYARELAEETGAISRDAGWPLHCIDWEQAAEELAMDYSSVTYQGTDYLVRS